MLNLALIPGNYVGWGVCSRYLIQELGKITPVNVLKSDPSKALNIKGEVFHTIGDHNLSRAMDITGTINYGYTFFESVLPDHAKANAKELDLLFAGSSWCMDRLKERGISWSDTLIQGIDPERFYPGTGEKPGAKDYFVIYSGGKLELRKGQDIVIKAVKVMQDRHKDILFVNCWHNSWAFSMNTMFYSPLITYRHSSKCSIDFINKTLSDNGIHMERTETLPLISQEQLKMVYDNTDIGLFPNRCEGGTNLVLMEYMACGKPVVASYNSGHTDILTASNSIRLMKMKPFELHEPNGDIIARWEEPDLDETIEALEHCYKNRDVVKAIGVQAGKDMKKYTWHNTAEDLISKIGNFRDKSGKVS